MFNPLRLLRRTEHIDDTATAYIEGRATERDLAELRSRAGREPGLDRDLDSLRDTVALLRSIDTVKAPRSFALAEAPVRVRVRRSRLAMAPAVVAIAAVAMVGLLAVGNLADIVEQSGQSADSIATRESAGDPGAPTSEAIEQGSAGALSATPAALGTPETTEPLAPSFGGDSDATIAGGEELFARATATPAAASGEAIAALPPESGSSAATAERAEATTMVPAPDTESATAIDSIDSAITEATVSGDSEKSFDFSMTDPEIAAPVTESVVAGEPAMPVDGEEQPAVEQPGSAVTLPVWQLEVVFAVIAVITAAAWFVLQRRLTA